MRPTRTGGKRPGPVTTRRGQPSITQLKSHRCDAGVPRAAPQQSEYPSLQFRRSLTRAVTTASSSRAARSLADDRAELGQRRDAALPAVRRMLQARGPALGTHSGLLVPWGLKEALAGAVVAKGSHLLGDHLHTARLVAHDSCPASRGIVVMSERGPAASLRGRAPRRDNKLAAHAHALAGRTVTGILAVMLVEVGP